MKNIKILIIILFTILFASCRSKKEASCPSFEDKIIEKKTKKKPKYEVVILKDGKRINRKKRKNKRNKKNSLFNKKMY